MTQYNQERGTDISTAQAPLPSSTIQPLKTTFWVIRRILLKAYRASVSFVRQTPRPLTRLMKNAFWATRRILQRARGKIFSYSRRGLKFARKAASRLQQLHARALDRVAFDSRRIPRRKNALVARNPVAAATKSSFEKRRARYERFAERALAFAREFQPDVVHAHDFSTILAATKIESEMAVEFVYDSHELWTERNRPNIVVEEEEKIWEQRTEAEAIRRAALSITVCDSIADHLSGQYGVARPLVIRNTPYRSTAALAFRGNGLRRRLQLKDSDFVTVYVGKIAANRGLLDILHALPSTPKRVKFVALGPIDPKFQPIFKQTVKSLRLKGRVFHYPEVPQERIVQCLSDCDLSLTTMNRVCLSYVYALPNKLFESLQAQLPVLGPDSPEIRRVIESFRCGDTYRDADPADLAAKINALASNPASVQACREGAKKASQELCWEIEERSLIEAYERLSPAKRWIPEGSALQASSATG